MDKPINQLNQLSKPERQDQNNPELIPIPTQNNAIVTPSQELRNPQEFEHAGVHNIFQKIENLIQTVSPTPHEIMPIEPTTSQDAQKDDTGDDPNTNAVEIPVPPVPMAQLKTDFISQILMFTKQKQAEMEIQGA